MSELRTLPREETSEKTIGEFVAEDYRTAAVFEKYGIDFCCGGKVSLSAACEEKGLDQEGILREIAAVKSEKAGKDQDFSAWDLARLADYIVETHHRYLWANTDQIVAYAQKIADVHGTNHPEVIEIAAIFKRIAEALTSHLQEEEELFFPAVKRLEAAKKAGAASRAADRNTIAKALRNLDREHEEVGDGIHEIRRLAGDYAIPEDVCNTFVVTYRKLKEFEDDLHKHVHLENNILFPKAQQL